MTLKWHEMWMKNEWNSEMPHEKLRILSKIGKKKPERFREFTLTRNKIVFIEKKMGKLSRNRKFWQKSIKCIFLWFIMKLLLQNKRACRHATFGDRKDCFQQEAFPSLPDFCTLFSLIPLLFPSPSSSITVDRVTRFIPPSRLIEHSHFHSIKISVLQEIQQYKNR